MKVAVRIVALLALAGATAYALDRLCLEPFRCARAASAGAVALEDIGSVRDHVRHRVVTNVLTRLADCDRTTHSRARVLATRADALRVHGDLASAIADYRHSLAIDRRPEVYLSLGLAQLDAYDRAGALDSLERACTFDPARLSRIPYDEVRAEVRQRLVAKYGPAWIAP
jgi:tetratricopeptide (TPR) repeat protein